jgi:hypothetical protein
MYLSTAFLTGLMFIVLITFPPRGDLWTYRAGLIAGALGLYVATMPFRKGLAIALNYFNSR